MCNQTDFQREEFVQLISQAAAAIAARWYDGGSGRGTTTLPKLSTVARDQEKVYSIKQCCELIGKSRATFGRRLKQYNAAQTNQKKLIKPIKEMLPTVLYRKADIDRMLK